MNTLKSGLFATALCGIVSLALTQSAHANFVLNGNFATTSPAAPNDGQISFNNTVANWSTAAYNFVFTSATQATTTGVIGQFPGTLTLYSVGVPPAGNFVGLDSDVSYNGALSQTINGLTAGQTYSLTFQWAGAQQTGFTGATTDMLQVSLGTEIHNTPVISVASMGFTGWNSGSLSFTATASQEVLSFLAIGTPINNEPPFAMLSSVDLEGPPGTPDGGLTIALLGGALVGLEGLRRKFFR